MNHTQSLLDGMLRMLIPGPLPVRLHGPGLPQTCGLASGRRQDLIAIRTTGQEPDDGYPVVLDEWITADGLKCLKIKLRGNDSAWDYQRLVDVGRIALERGVHWLSPDFNCLVTDPAYVNDILDKLVREHPAIYGKILYVEQPFPYDLENNRIDVHSVSARKPLFMDESCHDWRFVRMGRALGWTGVALKTCKTQTGALLSMCWQSAWHDIDGAGFDQPHAQYHSPHPAGGARREDYGGGMQCRPVLSGGVGDGERGASGDLQARGRRGGFFDVGGAGFRVPCRRDRASTAAARF